MNNVYVIIRHTLLKQMRSTSYLLTAILSIFLAFLCIPGIKEGYQIFYLGGVRGIYNSAWLGSVAAMLPVILLWLPGFYLLRNQISEDDRLKIGQSIASAPIGKVQYIGSKFLSNLAVLLSSALLFTFVVILMQFYRHESLSVKLEQYIAPFVFITIPHLFILSAFTVFFDVIPCLKGVFGNIILFAVWITFSTISAAMPGNVYDLFGIGLIFNQMLTDAKTVYPGLPDAASFGYYPNHGAISTFIWSGVVWENSFLTTRLMWMGIAVVLVIITAIIFNRFQTPEIPVLRTSITKSAYRDHLYSYILTPVKKSSHICFHTILKGELKIMVAGKSLWWYATVLIFVVLSYFIVSGEGIKWISLILLLPMGIWSQMGCREKLSNTTQLIISSCPRVIKWTASLTAGVCVSLFMSLGVLTRFAVNGAWDNFAAWVSGTLFITALALMCGTLSGSRSLFEGICLTLLYLGPINNIGPFDFLGVQSVHAAEYLILFILLCFVGIGIQLTLENGFIGKSLKRGGSLLICIVAISMGLAGCGNKTENSEDLPIDKIKNIVIKTGDNDIIVESADTDHVKASIIGYDGALLLQEGDTVHIKLPMTKGGIHLSKPQPLRVSVPSSRITSFTADSEYGSIKIDSVHTNILIHSEYGNIAASGLHGTVTANTQSGKIKSDFICDDDITSGIDSIGANYTGSLSNDSIEYEVRLSSQYGDIILNQVN